MRTDEGNPWSALSKGWFARRKDGKDDEDPLSALWTDWFARVLPLARLLYTVGSNLLSGAPGRLWALVSAV